MITSNLMKNEKNTDWLKKNTIFWETTLFLSPPIVCWIAVFVKLAELSKNLSNIFYVGTGRKTISGPGNTGKKQEDHHRLNMCGKETTGPSQAQCVWGKKDNRATHHSHNMKSEEITKPSGSTWMGNKPSQALSLLDGSAWGWDNDVVVVETLHLH